ncbi:MAG: hypothetical protein EA378_11525 [Phycisphaerales bacterium]|nr:MAG: hypothetical protein EA378_11525 [Phycisphaerales bacterium]
MSTAEGSGHQDAAHRGAKKPGRTPERRRRGLKIAVGVATGLLVLLVVVVLLLPTIVGGLARGPISRAASDSIDGDVQLDTLRIRWLGGVRAQGVRLLEPDGTPVADLTLETSKGLLGLAFAGGNFGEVRVSGEVDVRVDADGRTNLDRAIGTHDPAAPATPSPDAPQPQPSPRGEPSAPSPAAEPVRVPANLHATLVLDGLRIRYADPSLAEVSANELTALAMRVDRGRATLVAGEAATVDLEVRIERTGSATPVAPGALTLKLDARNWSTRDGLLTPELATGDIELRLDAPDLQLDAALAYADGRASLARELTLTAEGSAPLLIPILNAAGVQADRLAGVDVRVERFDLRPDRLPTLIAAIGSAMEGVAPAEPDAGDAVAVRARVGVREASLRLPPEMEGAPRRVRVENLALEINAADLAGDVTVALRAAGAADGAPLGNIRANLAARGLLSATPAISGDMTLPRLVPLLRPAMAAQGIDADELLGPTTSLIVALRGEGSADAPRVEARLDISGERVRLAAPLVFEGGVLRSGAQPITGRVDNLQALLGALQDAELPVEIAQAGRVDFRAADLRLPIALTASEAGPAGPDLSRLQLSSELTLSGASVLEATAGRVDVSRAHVQLVALPGEAGRTSRLEFTLQAAAEREGAPVTVQGNARSATLLGAITGIMAHRGDGPAPVLDPVSLGITGSLRVNDAPSALIAAFMPAPESDEAPDLAAAVRAIAGETAHLAIDLAPTAGGSAIAMRAWTGAQSLQARASLLRDALTVSELTINAGLGEPRARALATALRQDPALVPPLAEPVAMRVNVQPLRVPFVQGFEPDMSAVAALTLEATATLTAALRDYILPADPDDPESRPVHLGPIAIRPLTIDLALPLVGVLTNDAGEPLTTEPAAATLVARAEIRHGAQGGARLLLTETHASVPLAGGAPAGVAALWGTFNELDLAWVEQRFASEGAITGPLGPALFGEYAFDGNPAELAQLLAGETGLEPATVAARVFSQNLHAQERLTLRIEPATDQLPPRIMLAEPVTLPYVLPVAYGSTLLGEGGRLLEPVEANLHLERLTLVVPGHAQGLPGVAYGMSQNTGGPLVHEIFDLAGELRAAAAHIDLGPRGRVTLRDVRATLADASATFQQTLLVGLRATLTATPEQGGVRGEPITGDAFAMIADAYGHPIEQPILTDLNLDMDRVPTALVDALAQQNGLLVDILGSEISAKLRARELGVAGDTIGGYFELTASSPRATAELQGRVRDNVLALSSMEILRITQIAPELAQRFTAGLPLVSGFEKQSGDEPATVTVTDLRLPLDGNLANLAGAIAIDPGVGRFFTGELFSSLLRVEREHTIGQSLPPLQLTADAGVLKYDRFVLPLGEFSFETSGSVDLLRQQIDVLTWIPLGALTEEAAGAFNTSLVSRLGGDIPGLGRDTMMPFRTRGSLSNPSTAPDLETFIQTAPDRLAPDILERLLDGNTGREIERGLRDLLRRNRDRDGDR